MLVDRGTGTGKGSFTISNRTSESAVVKLVNSERQVQYGIFIRKDSDTTISAVDTGTYELWYGFGKTWDGKRFKYDHSAGKAEKQFPFRETVHETAEGIETRFDRRTVTLHTVVNGNLHTSSKGAEEFDQIQ